jgi:DNA repair protein RecO (recombination protein O)
MISKASVFEEALVLSASKYQENSAIVTVATASGLMGVLCRGIYKPKSSLKPLLVTGTLVDLEYVPSDNGPNLAKSLKVKKDHSDFLLDYPKSVFLMLLEELTLNLFHYGDSYPFEETKILLDALSQKADLLSISLLYLGTLYQHLGLEIETHECIRCHKAKNIVSYSLLEGGFICKDCLPFYEGIPEKEKMELYVLKFAFLPLDEANLNRVVPPLEGRKVFVEMIHNIMDYFDLKPIRTLELFINAINE